MTYKKITISGRICTGKTTLFWNLQKTLGWSTFSASQFFRDYARTHDVSLQKAEEQSSNVTRDVDQGMQKVLEQNEHVILEGWMAGIVANGLPDVLRLLLTCEDTIRIKRFAMREHISEREAALKVHEREDSWTKKLQALYHRDDFFDPKNYNCIVDTSDKTPEQVLEIILQSLDYAKRK